MKERPDAIKAIPIQDIVDYRLQGLSFDEITLIYATKLNWPSLSKMIVYGYYVECQSNGYYGYEPIPIATLSKHLKGTTYTIPEIANLFDLTVTGLKNYLADRKLGRTITVKGVRRMIQDGRTINYIAQYYGCSHQHLRNWMKLHGMEKDTILNNTLKKQIDLKIEIKITDENKNEDD